MPAPHFIEEIFGPIQPVPLERIVEQIVEVPVPGIREEIAEGTWLVPLGRIQERVVDQIPDMLG